MKTRESQRGNVFTILLGGVALAGALSYMMYQTMAGPVSSMMRVTKTTAAKSQILSLSRAVVLDALNQNPATSGDCDSDGSIEPQEWAAATGPAGSYPAGGGLLPPAMAPSVTDPWGTQYGYCVWDTGSKINDAACGGATQRRLAGSPNPSAGAAGTQTAFAIISAGPDRHFDTTCKTYATATTDTTNDLIAVTKDDVVSRLTYQEAAIAANGLWSLQPAAPGTATIAKDLTVAESPMSALSLVTADHTGSDIGQITATGGIQLGDQSKVPSCSAAGLMRYNTGSAVASDIRIVQALTTVKVAKGAGTASPASFGAAVANGDAVIVTIMGKATGGAFSVTGVTDDKGNPYAQVATTTVAGSNASVFIYARYNIANAPQQITVNYGGGTARSLSWGAMEISGITAADTASAPGALALTGLGAAPIIQSHAVSAAPTTQGNDFAVAVHGYVDATGDINVNYLPEPGWTQVFVNGDAATYGGFSTVTKVLPANATTPSHTWLFSATHTHNVSGDYAIGAIATFKGGTAPGTSGLEVCDGASWQPAGTGGSGGGALPAIVAIKDLYEGRTGYASPYFVGLGKGSLVSDTGTFNTAVGQKALASLTSGASDTALGHFAGYGLAATGSNTFIGSNSSGTSAAGAVGATGFGAQSLSLNGGTGNTGFGYKTLPVVGTGSGNTAFGAEALSVQSNADGATAFGYQALKANTAAGNTAFGYQALAANTTGTQNTAFGAQALAANTQGMGNSAFGYQALAANNNVAGDYGNYNSALGYQALAANTSGDNNTAAGYQALYRNTTGSNNTAIGGWALAANTTGSNSTAAGLNALALNTASGSTAAGYSALGANTAGVGNTAAGWNALAGNNTASGIQVVQASSRAGNWSWDHSPSSSFATLPAAGNTIVVMVGVSGSSGAQTIAAADISDNQPGGGSGSYQLAGSQSYPDGSTRAYVFYRSNISAPSGTFTITIGQPDSRLIWTALEVSGLSNSSPVDQTGSVNASAIGGSLAVSASGATAQANELAVSVFGYGGGDDNQPTPGGGWTRDAYNDWCSQGPCAGMGHSVLTSAGTAGTTWSFRQGNASTGTGLVVTFKGASTISVTQSVARDHICCNGNNFDTLSFPTLPSLHDTIIVAVEGLQTGGDPVVTDSQGGTYTLAVGNNTNSGNWWNNIYYRNNVTPAPTGTFTVMVTGANGSSQWTWAMLDVAGLATSNVLDQTGATTSPQNASSTVVSTAGPTSQADELAISGISPGTSAYAGAYTIGTADVVYTAVPVSSIYHKLLSSTGVASFTWSHPTADNGTTGSVIATFKGSGAAASADYGNYNTALGEEALVSNQGGDGNTAVGASALYSNLGSGNTVIGSDTLGANTTGGYNTYAGGVRWDMNPNGYENTTGSYNTALGLHALISGKTVDNQTAIGQWALASITTGTRNTAVGDTTLVNITSGTGNTVFGTQNAGQEMTIGNYNTAIGRGTMSGSPGGTYNTSVVYASGSFGVGNTNLGWSAPSGASGSYNTAMGSFNTLNCNGTGSYATAVGSNTLNSCSGGDSSATTAISTGWTTTGTGFTGAGTGGVGALDNVTGAGYGVMSFGATGSGETVAGYYSGVWANVSATPGGSSVMGSHARDGGLGGHNSIISPSGGGTGDSYMTIAGYMSDTVWWVLNNGGSGPGNSAVNDVAILGANVTLQPAADNIDVSHWIQIGNTSITSITGQVAWSPTSDRRLKKDIADSDLALDFIMKLRPVSYRLKKGNGRLDYGFIAQEVQEALGGRKTNMVDPGSDETPWRIRSDDIISPTVAAIQERQKIISRQQAEIDDLKAQVGAAEKALATLNGEAR